jgi:hypothetical protein
MRQRLRLVQVRLQEEVFSGRLGAEMEQLERLVEAAEHVRPVARENRRDKEEKLVD